MKLIECVLNISEGRDAGIIEQVAAAADRAGARVLDIDSTQSAGRSVITFAGRPEDVEEAAFQAIRQAVGLIDMRAYTGVHPCIGAADVCPLVPLFDTTLEECAARADALAARVGRELDIPVYLYGAAARTAERRKLAFLRRGGYSALGARIAADALIPDYGPARVGPPGGCAIGARRIMVAYNVTLDTPDAAAAARIAGFLRESGCLSRDEYGRVIRDAEGQAIRIPGRLACEAIGWYIADYGRAQVSTNLRRWEDTHLHLVYEEVRRLAAEQQLSLTGSEIVGLVPKQALLKAGEYYISFCPETSVSRCRVGERRENVLIEAAIEGLRLDDTKPFDPARKVLETKLSAVGLAAAE